MKRYMDRWLAMLLAVTLLLGMAQQAQAVAGEVASTTAYGGEVFLDLNMNGVREFHEAGVANVEVVIETLHGEVVASTVSDEEGVYFFAQLPLDDLRLLVIPPTRYHVTSNGNYTISTRSPQGTIVRTTGLSLAVFMPIIRAR